ncbi:hypothetical protein K7432_006357 [Basidiobolus ranarum]|uniref:Uncharacterized protein n=1 Tax=Basidiobolus ranarum TaxID=34480 RepID=A0ABR2WV23_9FUNG
MSKVWVLLKSTEASDITETKVAGVFSVFEEAYSTAIKETLIWYEEEVSIDMEEVYSGLKSSESEIVKVISYGNSIPLNLEEVQLSSIFNHLSEWTFTLYQRQLFNHTTSKGKNVESSLKTTKSLRLVRFMITSHLVDVYEADDEEFHIQNTNENSGEYGFSEEEVEQDEEDSDLEMDVDEDELNGLLEDLEHDPEQWLELARVRGGTDSETTTQPKPGSSKS